MRRRGSIYVAQDCAQVLFGGLGVAVRRRDVVQIGRFLSTPYVSDPPWPIEVWGEGDTVDDACQQATARWRLEREP